MTTAEFTSLTREVFAFLERNYGFAHSSDAGYMIRFDSSRVFVVVSYDRHRSHELSLQVGLQAGVAHKVERPFEISELLRVAIEPELANRLACLQITEDKVRGHLEELANVLVNYCGSFLEGKSELFMQLDKQRDADTLEYSNILALSAARLEANKAWTEGRFDNVVRALEPFKDRLSPAERKRLALATKRSGT